MKHFLFSALALLLLVSACAPTTQAIDSTPTAPPAATLPQLTSTAVATNPSQLPTATAGSSNATPGSANTPAASGGLTAFKIVPAESKVTYEVTETFLKPNNKINVSVGATNTLSGTINADKSNPSATSLGPVTVDVSKFTSDSSQRDNMIRRNFLQSSTYPTATFVTKSITGLPAAYTEGSDYTFQISGDLTVKNTTQPAIFQVTARLKGDTLSGTATSQVLMSQFGVGPISLLGILQTQDEVKITFDFVARP
jgi:polyisoprenoid-binding protein YceI